MMNARIIKKERLQAVVFALALSAATSALAWHGGGGGGYHGGAEYHGGGGGYYQSRDGYYHGNTWGGGGVIIAAPYGGYYGPNNYAPVCQTVRVCNSSSCWLEKSCD